MKLELEGRRAVVCGASRGLGRAIAVSLAHEGCEVLAIARNAGRLAELEQMSMPTGKVRTIVGDLTDHGLASQLRPELEAADILVLNSGGPPAGPVSAVSEDIWRSQFELMFVSMIRLAGLALPGMRQRGFGRILPIVSSGVVQPIPGLGISNALRLAVTGWAKTLAEEVAAVGVTVNCLAPGRIATDRVDELDRGRADKSGLEIEAVRAQSRAAIPVGRYGEAEEFASIATFIASARASYITGSVLRIDGGFIKAL